MKTKLKRVSMNLNERSLDNVNKICELTKEYNKTRAIAISLEISRKILELYSGGDKIIFRNETQDREISFLF